jgi:hypothetical protein
MYTVTYTQGRDLPLDASLFEEYPGEGREIFLQSFINEGTFSETEYTLDTETEEEIELKASEWLSAYEIAQLKTLAANAPESLWDGLTVSSLMELLQEPTELKEVA